MDFSWNLDRDASRTPREVADRLEQAIRAGELPAGTRLPAQRDLAEALEVSPRTVERAMAEAKRRGLIDARVGRGTFVRDVIGPLRAVPVGPALGPDGDAATDPAIDLGSNHTFVLPLEREGLKRTLRAIARESDLAEAPAGLDRGGEHVSVAWTWLEANGYTRDGAEARLATSAQHGLLGVLMALVRPGSGVAHGDSLFPGVRSAVERLGSPLVAIDEDEQGPRPDALEAALARHSIACFVLSPTLAPLRNRTLTESRRRELVEVARRRELLLVEDEDDGIVLEERPTPLQALAPERVISVVETSKAFASGSRLAYVVAPVGLQADLANGQRVVAWSVPWLPAEVATRWIESGLAARAVRERRAELARRHDLARALLGRLLGPAGLVGPGAAHTAWLELPAPWTSLDVERGLRARGIHVAASTRYAGRPERAPDGLRICLGGETEDRLRRGLGELAELLSGPFRSARSWD